MSENKKTPILGSSMFNFIANMVSKTTVQSSEPAPNKINEDVDMKNDEEQTLIETSSTEYVFVANEETYQKETSKLATDLSTELIIDSSSDREECNLNKRQEKEIKISASNSSELKSNKADFKCTSISTGEYQNSNFLKGCKWSPDGTCIITNSSDSVLRIYDTSHQMLNSQVTEEIELPIALRLVEPEIIYDYAWYPYMDSSNPTSACVFSSCKDNPVHLFDAYTGEVRCSYKGYNHLVKIFNGHLSFNLHIVLVKVIKDELVSAYCIAFDSTSSKMYCGYNKCLKVFDISRPGRNYVQIETNKGQYKLPGIVSCISFPAESNGLFAVGTYSKYIGLFDEESNKPMCVIESHSGGLTHLQFSKDGNKLFSGARKDSDILCWDIRNIGKVLQVYKRDVQTNQRIYFDLYSKYLCSGSDNGLVKLWDVEDSNSKEELPKEELTSFKAHNDCVNGVSFNHVYPLLATASGQRKFFTNKNSDSSDSDSDSEPKKNSTEENSLKIWKHNLSL